MGTAQVTVVMPFYNPDSYIIDAIESVLNQTFIDWELLLVDDGTTESYYPKIKKYLNDSRIRLIRMPMNKGQSKALNKGLEYVETPYFIQLDSDDWYDPNTLQVLVNEAKKQPEDVAVISGNINIVL